MPLTIKTEEVSESRAKQAQENSLEKIPKLTRETVAEHMERTCGTCPYPNVNEIMQHQPNSVVNKNLPVSSGRALLASLDEVHKTLQSLTVGIKGLPCAPTAIICESERGATVEWVLPHKAVDHNRTLREAAKSNVDDVFAQTLMRTAPEAIVTTTADGHIDWFNDKAQSLFGYKRAEILGANIAVLLEPLDHSAAAPLHHAYCAQIGWHAFAEGAGYRGRKRNGEFVPIEISMSECGLRESKKWIFYIKDLSAIRRYEQRIAELEREVTFLSLHSILGELATTITHELCQPLTAITNYTAAATRCLAQASSDIRESSLELITKAGDQAKRAWLIIHRLRRLLQHSGTECARNDLRTSIEEAIQLATLGAAQHGIDIKVELPAEPVTVLSDHVQIEILVSNLIRNAVDELIVSNGEKRMHIRLRVTEDNFAEVSIEDTGAGIAPEVFENIFDPFHTTKPQGLGVGLAVSRRIAQAHGGRLSAENRPEGGAVFRFVIPVCV
jgi:two-component system sensor kinase FixL